MKCQRTRWQRLNWRLRVGLLLAGLLLSPSQPGWSQTGGEITATENYYLVKSIDESLVKLAGLTGAFERKRISENLRPRNVFEKTLDLAQRFNVLFPNALNPAKLDELSQVADVSRTTPADAYAVLNLLKAYLVAQGTFQETTDAQTPKTPSDVFHIMRQLSWHYVQIAQQKGLSVKWGTAAQVYDTVVTTVLPAMYGMAADAKITYNPYLFPRQPVSKVQPRNIYKLLRQIYTNIATYYAAKGNYEPLKIVDVTDCDEITPADAFDLAQVAAAELKANLGGKTLAPDLAVRYAEWKKTHEQVEPGHTFRLLQHLFILTKQIGENTGN